LGVALTRRLVESLELRGVLYPDVALIPRDAADTVPRDS
jgi:hypothetical protein